MRYKKVNSNKDVFFEGPLVLIPNKYSDERGFFMESWNSETFNKITKSSINFVQDNHSNSKKNVLRGLHYQLPPNEQGKLVRCISGKIFDVIVDIRKSSETFLEWGGIFLDSNSHEELWIPSGFAHGFLSVSDNTEIIYKTTSLWSKKDERSIRWNDTNIGINWPLDNQIPLLSIKDRESNTIKNISKNEFFP